MNDFLFAHKKSCNDLTVLIDANLKKNILSSVQFQGKDALKFQNEILEIQKIFINQPLDKIFQIKIINSKPLWLLYEALDEYQGHKSVFPKEKEFVCLCFGDQENLRGRACGSCIPFIKTKTFNKILGMYPGPLAIKLDELKEEWEKSSGVSIEIFSIKENYLEVKMSSYSKEKLKELSDFWFLKLNHRFFLRACP